MSARIRKIVSTYAVMTTSANQTRSLNGEVWRYRAVHNIARIIITVAANHLVHNRGDAFLTEPIIRQNTIKVSFLAKPDWNLPHLAIRLTEFILCLRIQQEHETGAVLQPITDWASQNKLV